MITIDYVRGDDEYCPGTMSFALAPPPAAAWGHMNDAGAEITAEQIERWRAYIGRSETRRQVLDVESLVRFAAAVGSDLDVERFPPPLGHWAYFAQTVASGDLAMDGHPKRGDRILPPVGFPQRMFAASSITFFGPLLLQREAELTLTVADIRHKCGKSGELVLIDVDRLLMQDGTQRIAERQTLIYRATAQRIDAVRCVGRELLPGDAAWIPGPVELFRFSAATFNSHRIHYDLDYARLEEGYPALVVHGPLTAARLFAHASERFGFQEPPHTFQFRALAPLFAGQRVTFEAADGEGRIDAVRCDGVVAMTARCGALRGT